MEVYMVIDCQWGSTGKGLIAGYLAHERMPDTVVCNFGPNAGHTYISKDGEKYMFQQLPTGAINTNAKVLIGPGAIINPDILMKELETYSNLKTHLRLAIHPHAAVVTQEDLDSEKATMNHIASTKKGVGSAAARKIGRPATGAVARDFNSLKQFVVEPNTYNNFIRMSRLVQIESAQGFDLSMNHGHEYPFTTSRDVTPEAVCNDVGIPLRFVKEVVGVFRTFPIRVGNEFNKDTGEQIGHSGGFYKDQREMTWDEVGALTGTTLLERTTVTNKVRRVFSWSWSQFHKAMWFVKPDSIFMNFMNYLPPSERVPFLYEVDAVAQLYGKKTHVRWAGYGPTYWDVTERRP